MVDAANCLLEVKAISLWCESQGMLSLHVLAYPCVYVHCFKVCELQ